MKNPNTRLLSVEINGRGRVKGYLYKQLVKTPKAYLYEVSHPDTEKIDYEVFKRRTIEFGNREIYPSAESFGEWAWAKSDKESALKKLEDISS